MDLRRCQWVARRETETVKTKDEIHKQFHQQKAKQAPKGRKNFRHHDHRGQRPPQIGPPMGNSRGAAIGIRSSGQNRGWGPPRGNSTTSFAIRSNTQDVRPNTEVRKFLKQDSNSSQNSRRFGNRQDSARSPRTPVAQTASSPRMARGPSKKDLKEKFKKDVLCGENKNLDDKKVDKWLQTATEGNYAVFFEYFLTASSACQAQLLVNVRDANRSKKVNHKTLIAWARKFAPTLNDFASEQDTPKAAEYFGRSLSEFVHTGSVPIQVLVNLCSTIKEDDEARNKFMMGLLKSLLELNEESPQIFDNLDVIAKGFCLEPKKFGKPCRRSSIPASEDFPVLTKILGEDYEKRIKLGASPVRKR